MPPSDHAGWTPAHRLARRIAATVALAAALVVGALALAGAAQAEVCQDCGGGGGGGGGTGTTTYTLTLNVSGLGSVGTTTKSCNATCSWTFDADTVVHLTQSPFYGWAFSSWGGACAGAGSTCDVTMSSSRSVSATFADVPPADALIDAPAENQVFTSTTGGAVTVNFQTYDPTSQWDKIECLVDGVSRFKPCTSGFSTGPLATGNHTVTIRQVDSTNNAGDTNRHFKVVNLPTSKITAGPGPVVGSHSAAFQYSGGDGQRCAVDAAVPDAPAAWAFATCPGSFSDLADGVHTLSVQTYVLFEGVKYFGSVATRSWRVDTTPPETILDAKPPTTTSDQAAQFAFHGADATALSYECKLDAGTFGACPGGATGKAAYAKLAAGKHTFAVRATDAVGLVDPTPATYAWTIVSADADNDGVFSPGTPNDCNDSDPSIHPGAVEILDDGIDQNCDGDPGVNPDRDGDGVQRPADCNDGNAAIHPGAHDVPENGVDEDCAGGDAKFARPLTSLLVSWGKASGRTNLPVFRLSGVPAGGKVTVLCKGAGCTFKSKTVKLKQGRADLSKTMKALRLAKGATVDVRTTATEMLTYTIRVKVVGFGLAKTSKLCAKPGTSKTTTCS